MTATKEQIEAAAEQAYLNNRGGSKPWSDLSEQHKADWLHKVTSVVNAALSLSPPAADWEPKEYGMLDYWQEAIGGSYKPFKLSKHESSHPTTVKRVLDAVRGTEAADVIVGLIFWTQIARNREDELLKLVAASPPADRGSVVGDFAEKCELAILRQRDAIKAWTHQDTTSRMAIEVLDKAAATIRSLASQSPKEVDGEPR